MMNTVHTEQDQPIRAWEVLWRDESGLWRSTLCQDRDRAEIYSVRYHGMIRDLVWPLGTPELPA